jgi:hypothetical protein
LHVGFLWRELKISEEARLGRKMILKWIVQDMRWEMVNYIYVNSCIIVLLFFPVELCLHFSSYPPRTWHRDHSNWTHRTL